MLEKPFRSRRAQTRIGCGRFSGCSTRSKRTGRRPKRRWWSEGGRPLVLPEPAAAAAAAAAAATKTEEGEVVEEVVC
jgi:hypothetical protein